MKKKCKFFLCLSHEMALTVLCVFFGGVETGCVDFRCMVTISLTMNVLEAQDVGVVGVSWPISLSALGCHTPTWQYLMHIFCVAIHAPNFNGCSRPAL